MPKIKKLLPRSFIFIAIITIILIISLIGSKKKSEDSLAKAVIPCLKNNKQDTTCYTDIISKAVKKEGIHRAFSLFKYLYQTQPLFIRAGCHRMAHILGEAAYGEFRKQQNINKIPISQEVNYCGYGYLHGFFEHFFRETKPKIELARSICDSLSKKFTKTLPRIRLNCYHAMGHGFMPDPPPKSVWGNPLLLVDSPLRHCNGVSSRNDPDEVRECYEGVFNVLIDWISGRRYKLSFEEKDFFKICNMQKKLVHKRACYYEFSMRISDYAASDLIKVAKIASTIDIPDIARTIVHNAAATAVQEKIYDKKNQNMAGTLKINQLV